MFSSCRDRLQLHHSFSSCWNICLIGLMIFLGLHRNICLPNSVLARIGKKFLLEIKTSAIWSSDGSPSSSRRRVTSHIHDRCRIVYPSWTGEPPPLCEHRRAVHPDPCFLDRSAGWVLEAAGVPKLPPTPVSREGGWVWEGSNPLPKPQTSLRFGEVVTSLPPKPQTSLRFGGGGGGGGRGCYSLPKLETSLGFGFANLHPSSPTRKMKKKNI